MPWYQNELYIEVAYFAGAVLGLLFLLKPLIDYYKEKLYFAANRERIIKTYEGVHDCPCPDSRFQVELSIGDKVMLVLGSILLALTLSHFIALL